MIIRYEEKEIETQLKSYQIAEIAKDIKLGGVLAVYRNLRENYEYRLKYDEAGEFFIREIEMKRNYRQIGSAKKSGSSDDEGCQE